jgi:hypothetical protein
MPRFFDDSVVHEDIFDNEGILLNNYDPAREYERRAGSRAELKNEIKKLARFWYLPLVLLFVLLFGNKLVFLGVIILMMAVTLLVDLHRLVVPFNIGVEVVIFCAIILSTAVNPIIGAIFAVAATFLSHIISNHISGFLVLKSIVYIILCMLAPFLAPLGIVTAGIILVVLANLAFIGSNLLTGSGRIFRDLPIAIVHVTINAWLFSVLGNFLIGFF